MPTSPVTPTTRRRTGALKTADSALGGFPAGESTAVDTAKTHPAWMSADGAGSAGVDLHVRPSKDAFASANGRSPRASRSSAGKTSGKTASTGKGKLSLVGFKDALEGGARELTVKLRSKVGVVHSWKQRGKEG